jgi:hypothetical protein
MCAHNQAVNAGAGAMASGQPVRLGSRRPVVFSSAPKSLPQSSDCFCNGIRVVLMRGLQVSGFYKFADQLVRGFRRRSSIDFGHWHSASIN